MDKIELPIEGSQPEGVPWTTRDVWLGVGSMGLWAGLAVAVTLAVRQAGWQIDAGLLIGLLELLLLIPIWWFVQRKYGVGWRALGLRGFDGRALGLGCGLMILAFFFNALYGLLLALFDLQVQIDLVAIFEDLSSPWWLMVAGIVVAPVVEEIFFRGFVYAGLARRYDWKAAALLSSALFAVVHLQPTAILPIFVLGLVFAMLYRWSGSIWPAILMHIAQNALGLGAAYLVAQTGLG